MKRSRAASHFPSRAISNLVALALLSLASSPGPALAQPAATPPPLTAEQIFAKVSPAVVRVDVRDKDFKAVAMGSGFFVSSDGLLVTNYHVVQNANFATVQLPTSVTMFVDGILALDKDADLALLKVNGKGLPTLSLADGAPSVGARVYAVGNPMGLTNTISEGLISGLRELTSFAMIQTTAAISPGSSGGPLVLSNAQVAGVTTAYLKGGQNLNLAVPTDSIRKLLKAPRKLVQLSSVSGTPLDAPQTDVFGEVSSALEKKDYASALRQLSQMRESQQANPVYWLMCGNAHYGMENYSLALVAYQTAIGLKPDSAGIYFNMGLTYRFLGKHDDALKAFRAAIRLKSDYLEPHYNMGVVYLQLGRYDEALRCFQAVIRLNPDDVGGPLGMGGTYMKLGKLDEARNAFERASQLDPTGGAGNSAREALRALSAR